MLEYIGVGKTVLLSDGQKLDSFVRESSENIDWKTVTSFGSEWEKFSRFTDEEIGIGACYFDIVTPAMLNRESVVLDVGCGTGRWTKYLAHRVKFIEAIDPSSAALVASRFLSGLPNVRVSQADVDNIPFEDESFDFVYSLGVLHHIPDAALAMRKCVAKVKPGGWFLVYLYYNLDNRNALHRLLLALVNVCRQVICRLPKAIKHPICDLIALTVYYPLAAVARGLSKVPGTASFVKQLPLSYYCDKPFNILRNDALDRFGTPLEQRFSRNQIREMMESVGLTDIVFSEHAPFWHAVGRKR